MYGCHVVPPNDAGADLGVVFFHNEGYSTACGHGTIALVTWALESGVLPMTGAETPVTVDVPSGRLACVARWDARRPARDQRPLPNVPSFVLATRRRARRPRGARSPSTWATAAPSTARWTCARSGWPSTGPACRRSSSSSASCARPSTPPSRSSTRTSRSCAASTGSSAGRTSRLLRATTPRSPSATSRSSPTARWTDRRAGAAPPARLALLHAAGRIRTGETLRHRSIVDCRVRRPRHRRDGGRRPARRDHRGRGHRPPGAAARTSPWTRPTRSGRGSCCADGPAGGAARRGPGTRRRRHGTSGPA